MQAHTCASTTTRVHSRLLQRRALSPGAQRPSSEDMLRLCARAVEKEGKKVCMLCVCSCVFVCWCVRVFGSRPTCTNEERQGYKCLFKGLMTHMEREGHMLGLYCTSDRRECGGTAKWTFLTREGVATQRNCFLGSPANSEHAEYCTNY